MLDKSKKSNEHDDAVIIKKYANRRLYNTESSTYVTLDDLAQMVHEGLESALQSGPKFRCESCGLTPRMQFWQCPSCKQWARVRPVSDRL